MHPSVPTPSQIVMAHVPIENSTTEGTSTARPTQEQVPDGVPKGRGLSVRREAGCTSSATEANCYDLPLRLAEFDVGGEEATVGHGRPGEDWVIVHVTDLSE